MFTKTGKEQTYKEWWIEQKNNQGDETLRVQNLDVFVSANTFSPSTETTNSVDMMMRHMPDMTKGRVLEIGTGCGILVLHALFNAHAETVVATEIDKQARKDAERNFERHDVTDNITLLPNGTLCAEWGRFDYIIANIIFSTPHLDKNNLTEVAHSTLAIHDNLFRLLPDLLNEGGRCCLGFASFGDTDGLEKLIRTYNLTVQTKVEEEKFGVHWYYLEVSPPPTLG